MFKIDLTELFIFLKLLPALSIVKATRTAPEFLQTVVGPLSRTEIRRNSCRLTLLLLLRSRQVGGKINHFGEEKERIM